MTGKELASYYRAAVEYIDPRLREDCPVEDICAAAKARQHALRAHDSDTARLEHEKIEEALQFIQRVHPDVVDICREHVQEISQQSPEAMWAPVAQAEPEPVNGRTAEYSIEEACGTLPETDPAQDLHVSMVEVNADADAPADDVEPEAAGEYAGVLLSGHSAGSDDDEIVELVLGSAMQAVDGADVAAGSADMATEPLLETDNPVTADGPGPEALAAGPEPVHVDNEAEAVANPDLAATEAAMEPANATGSEAAREPVRDGGSELAAAMAAPREAADVPSRHQFIAELRERRLSSQQGLAEDEALQLITELREEQHSEERVSELISRVPDVSERMEQELQQEEESSHPLDFRSLMQRAGANAALQIRPARRPRLKTEEILSRGRPVRRIPEEHAAPILLGMLLILWQFSTALLAGFALSRVLVWHFGTAFASMSPVRAMFACLVGVGTAALIGAGFRYYRMRSHRLSLPVHVTALSFLLLLLSWQFSANANAYVSGPPLWLWCMLFASWLVATIAAGLHDLRVPPVSRDTEAEVVASKPAVPLAN